MQSPYTKNLLSSGSESISLNVQIPKIIESTLIRIAIQTAIIIIQAIAIPRQREEVQSRPTGDGSNHNRNPNSGPILNQGIKDTVKLPLSHKDRGIPREEKQVMTMMKVS
jgi:hypothetical protein